MSTVLSNVKVLDCSSWRNSRNVEVNTIDIQQGTLKSTSATSHTLQPTYKEHDFMQKSGFTKYCYETTIRVVEMVGNETTLYSDILINENKGIGYITKVQITDEQFNKWLQSNQFIKFIKDGEVVEYVENDDWLNDLLSN